MFDLIDEMVHSWKLQGPFRESTLVSLVEIDAPVGLDDRFQVEVENHLLDVLTHQPGMSVKLGFCSACRKWVVKSTQRGTYFSRGIDQPDILKSLQTTHSAKYGLSLGFEADHQNLVLRAQIFSLAEDGQPLVWAQTYSTSSSSRLVLQKDTPLLSLKEARVLQDDIINRREPLKFVTRTTMRMFGIKSSGGFGATSNAPVLFLEQSIESQLLPKKDRRMAFTIGATSIDKAMWGYSVGGHFANLLFKNEPSLINPDVYLILGMQFVRMRGPAALIYGAEELDIVKIRNRSTEPRASLMTYRLGVEAHIKNRFGALIFIENVPTLSKSKLIKQEKLLGLTYHDYGVGMVMQW